MTTEISCLATLLVNKTIANASTTTASHRMANGKVKSFEFLEFWHLTQKLDHRLIVNER